MGEFIPQVSLIIPVFNGEKYIESALFYALKFGACVSFEIIIVNDASTDNTLLLANKFLDSISCNSVLVSVITNKQNEGALQSRIKGAKAAKAKYLIFADVDDYYEENTLKFILETAQKDNFDLVQMGHINLYQNGNKTMRFGNISASFYNNKEYTKFCIKSKELDWGPCAKLILKDKFLKAISVLDGIKISRAEDVLQNFCLYCEVNRVYVLDKCFYCVNINDNSTSGNKSIENKQKWIDEMQIVINTIKSLKDKNEKLARIFLENLNSDFISTQYELKKYMNKINLKDKISKFLFKQKFRFKRYFRIHFGIVL